MPYQIQDQEGFVEVQGSGKLSFLEVLSALHELHVKFPLKEVSDLWVLPDNAVIPPLATFPAITKFVRGFCLKGFFGKKTAIVSRGALQHAFVDLYEKEAKSLPFETRSFSSREQAINWLKS